MDKFKKELECNYKDETYLVRDNGAILRCEKLNGRKRKLDDVWTFGNLDKKTGYLKISSERVHRIVATAFHGQPPTDQHVVDHIDTNRSNNRPENLRWVTKLENVLLNPITRKKIEYVCGVRIETFLKNPEEFRECFNTPDISWMKTVTKEEALNSLTRFNIWLEKDQIHQPVINKSIFKEWIYKPIVNTKTYDNANNILIKKLTPSYTDGAVQYKWKTPNVFPLCPSTINENVIEEYYDKLYSEAVYCKNIYGESTIFNYAMSIDMNKIVVIAESGSSIKPWAVSTIYLESNLVVHESIGMFFTKEGAEKQYTISQGLEWTGEDSIDDYC